MSLLQQTWPVFLLRTLPAKHVGKIAEQMRTHNINALLVIGGFEVCGKHPFVLEKLPAAFLLWHELLFRIYVEDLS